MDAGSLLSIISLALDTWSCQSPTVFCFVTAGPLRLRGSVAALRRREKIVYVIKWCYYGFTHTSEYVFLLRRTLSCFFQYVMLLLKQSEPESLAHRGHEAEISTKINTATLFALTHFSITTELSWWANLAAANETKINLLYASLKPLIELHVVVHAALLME